MSEKKLAPGARWFWTIFTLASCGLLVGAYVNVLLHP